MKEEGHVIMDCPFLPFHIRIGIARHVELQNVARFNKNNNKEFM